MLPHPPPKHSTQHYVNLNTRTPQHQGGTPVIMCLAGLGADVDSVCDRGYTPLMEVLLFFFITLEPRVE